MQAGLRGASEAGTPKGNHNEEWRLGCLWVPEESDLDRLDTMAMLEPTRMATNKSGGGPGGWDVTPQGKRGYVDAASK